MGRWRLDKKFYVFFNKTMKTKKVLKVLPAAAAESDETRVRILAAARIQFFQFGFSQITTDAIASSSGISKATLYKYFSSKEQLLREIVFGLLGEIEVGVEAIIQDEKKDFVEKLRELLTFIGLRLARMGRLLTLDIQRNAPQIWKEIEEFRRDKILSKLKQIIEQGTKTGVFRADFNQDLLVLMYVTLIQNIMNPATLVQYSLSFAEGFETIVKIVLEGILAEKSRARYLYRRPTSRKKFEDK
jgi:AcrR family transcriptional regulator